MTDIEKDTFEKDDGTVYERVDPSEFASYDEVDSTTVEDNGTPEGDA